MSFAVSFRGDFSLLSRCSSCSAAAARFQPALAPSSFVRFQKLKCSQVSRKRLVSCRVTETDKEPDGNDDKEREEKDDGNLMASTSTPVENGSQPNPEPEIVDRMNNSEAEVKAQGGVEEGGSQLEL